MNEYLELTGEVLDNWDELEDAINDLLVSVQHLSFLEKEYIDRDDLSLFWWGLCTVVCNIQQYADTVAFYRKNLDDAFQKDLSSDSVSEMPESIPNNGKASNA